MKYQMCYLKGKPVWKSYFLHYWCHKDRKDRTSPLGAMVSENCKSPRWIPKQDIVRAVENRE